MNVFTRALPKPIVYAFVGLLVLGVVIPLGWKAYKASQSTGTGTSTRTQPGQTGSGQATISSDDLAHWGESVTPTELEDALRRDSSLVQQKDSELWTVLHFSAAALRADLIPILIEHGADPNAFNAEGQTPLHVVLFMEANAEYLADRLGQHPGDYEPALRALLENGAAPNASQPGSAEGSPIAWAQANGLVGSADILTEYGGDSVVNPPTYPTLTVSKGDELFATWNALSAAGFQEISTAEVASAIDPDRAGEIGMSKAFLTPAGGCIVIALGEGGKVGTLIYWPDAASRESADGIQYLDSVELRLP